MPTKSESVPFVIEDAKGEALRDETGEVIILTDEPEAEYFSEPVEQVRPFDPATDKMQSEV